MRTNKQSSYDQQVNITLRSGRTFTIWIDNRRLDKYLYESSVNDIFKNGLVIPAFKSTNTKWYPPHEIVDVEFMETRPEKPRDLYDE